MLALAVPVLAGTVSAGWPAEQSFKEVQKQLKERQKAEWKALEFRHKLWEESVKKQDVPKAQRIQMKNQRKREERELKNRHKDERQDLKDRQRILEESEKQLYQ